MPRSPSTRKGTGTPAGGAGYGGPARGGVSNSKAGIPGPGCLGVTPGNGKKARAADLAKEHVALAVDVWRQVMLDKNQPAAARIAAADHMVKRAEGNPVQPTEVTMRTRAEDMTDDELAEIAAGGGEFDFGAEGTAH